YSGRLKNGVSESEAKKRLFMELSRVRKLSKNKLPSFRDFILHNQKYLENCIIFVEEMSFGAYVQDILINICPEYHTYYHGDEKSNLEKFAKGDLKLLITCKRLSQGIDIRSVKNIILFSANRGQLETIQRIGRCIRIDPTNPDKRACVIDFISDKPDKSEDDEFGNADEEREKWLTELSKIKRKINNGIN
ncbi:MAG: helicase, partial [Nitrososphaerota archaeon]|nr:helicase [Nitrososphaerota archaeon]